MKSLTETFTPQTNVLLDLRNDLRQRLSSTLSSTVQETPRLEASSTEVVKTAMHLSSVFSEIHQLLALYETVLGEQLEKVTLLDSMEESSGSDQNIVH